MNHGGWVFGARDFASVLATELRAALSLLQNRHSAVPSDQRSRSRVRGAARQARALATTRTRKRHKVFRLLLSANAGRSRRG